MIGLDRIAGQLLIVAVLPPGDAWLGTLISKGGVHPTAERAAGGRVHHSREDTLAACACHRGQAPVRYPCRQFGSRRRRLEFS